jgi:hypothetical protein
MRLKNIIITDLAHSKLICYEKLERTMNSDGDVDEISRSIKKQLKQLVLLNGMIAEWNEITNHDEKLKDNSNG